MMSKLKSRMSFWLVMMIFGINVVLGGLAWLVLLSDRAHAGSGELAFCTVIDTDLDIHSLPDKLLAYGGNSIQVNQIHSGDRVTIYQVIGKWVYFGTDDHVV